MNSKEHKKLNFDSINTNKVTYTIQTEIRQGMVRELVRCNRCFYGPILFTSKHETVTTDTSRLKLFLKLTTRTDIFNSIYVISKLYLVNEHGKEIH